MNSRSRLVVSVLIVLALATNFGIAYYAKNAIDQAATSAASGTSNTQNKVTVAHAADPLPGKPTKEQFYSQPLNWRQCEASEITSTGVSAPRDIDKYQCASLTAPLDWENLDGNQITLALAVPVEHRCPQLPHRSPPLWAVGLSRLLTSLLWIREASEHQRLSVAELMKSVTATQLERETRSTRMQVPQK